ISLSPHSPGIEKGPRGTTRSGPKLLLLEEFPDGIGSDAVKQRNDSDCAEERAERQTTRRTPRDFSLRLAAGTLPDDESDDEARQHENGTVRVERPEVGRLRFVDRRG